MLTDHAYWRGRAALELGVSRMTLYKKMKKYGFGKRQECGTAALATGKYPRWTTSA